MLKKLLTSAVLALSLVSGAHANGDVSTLRGKPDIVEVLELRGEVGDHTTNYFKEQVEKINENPKIKAVVLIVQTPGGGAISTSNSYEELSKIKVPVVAWCTSMCASGGMYIMMSPAVKYSAVRNDAIAGSIGVVMSITNYSRLLDYLKIDNTTFKSGALKDSGNPSRSMTNQDKEYLQGIVNSLATGFYEAVEKSRGSKIKDWDAVKSARIFIGKDAVKVGLVDSVMDFDQAVNKAKELSGSKNIFLREELRKIAKSASAGADDVHDEVKQIQPTMQKSPYGDIGALVEMVKEAKEGNVVKFEYRLPYKM